MLRLLRRFDESLFFVMDGVEVEVVILGQSRGGIELGIKAPRCVVVLRDQVARPVTKPRHNDVESS